MKRIRRILYASDFSSASRRAFDTALMMAKSLNAKLAIVYVLPPVVTVPDLPKFFLGSVAERVVSTAACPVITVRGK